jgi:hypothetical protein
MCMYVYICVCVCVVYVRVCVCVCVCVCVGRYVSGSKTLFVYVFKAMTVIVGECGHGLPPPRS